MRGNTFSITPYYLQQKALAKRAPPNHLKVQGFARSGLDIIMQLNRQFILFVTLVIGLNGCDLSSVIEPQLPSQAYNEQTRHQLAISMQHSDPYRLRTFSNMASDSCN